MRFLLFAAALALPFAVHADTTIKCNENGAVVTSASGSVYYLGKSCDAARKGGGTGKWWFAAAAFIVQIDGEQGVRFSQEMICDIPYCKP